MTGDNANDVSRFEGPPATPPRSTRPGGFDQAPPPPTSSSAPAPNVASPVEDHGGDSASATADAISAVDLLKTMFDVVLAEADRNPRFAEALISTLPDKAVVDVTGSKPRKQGSSQPPFDPHCFSLVATYQKLGEENLREKLDSLTKDQIIRMADAQSISLSNNQKRKRKSTIITATLKATQDRLADRFAASG